MFTIIITLATYSLMQVHFFDYQDEFARGLEYYEVEMIRLLEHENSTVIDATPRYLPSLEAPARIGRI